MTQGIDRAHAAMDIAYETQVFAACRGKPETLEQLKALGYL